MYNNVAIFKFYIPLLHTFASFTIKMLIFQRLTSSFLCIPCPDSCQGEGGAAPLSVEGKHFQSEGDVGLQGNGEDSLRTGYIESEREKLHLQVISSSQLAKIRRT